MQLQQARSEKDVIMDSVYAAMETGNAGLARTIITEYFAIDEKAANRIRLDVLNEYGINL